MAYGKFATAIACIDGRAYGPVVEWVKKNYGVDYVDLITAPGADKDAGFAKAAVEISVAKHGSKAIVVAGHDDCAGNPVTEEQQKARYTTGGERGSIVGVGAEVIGVWVSRKGGTWEAKRVEG